MMSRCRCPRSDANCEMRCRVPGTLTHGSTLTLEADIDRVGSRGSPIRDFPMLLCAIPDAEIQRPWIACRRPLCGAGEANALVLLKPPMVECLPFHCTNSRAQREAADSQSDWKICFELNSKNSSCIGSKKELYSPYSRPRREFSRVRQLGSGK